MPDTQPVVSICCITYNHEKYIRDAIEGFLMQETDFPIEIIIHDDASTDSTPDIIREYADKYPNLIVPIFQTENQYSQGKRILGTFVIPRARGKYIALCEGDDYWTSPLKLQRQVEYMEMHPECRICFHAVRVVYDGEPDRPSTVRRPPSEEVINFERWLKYSARYGTYIATASILFRTANQPLPDWYHKLRFAGDWPLIVWLLLLGGELGFIDEHEPMAVYRKHAGGATREISPGSAYRLERFLAALHDHAIVSKQLNMRQRKWLRFGLFKLHTAAANEYLLIGDKIGVRHHIGKSILYMPIFSKRALWSVFVLTSHAYFPKLHLKLRKIKSHCPSSTNTQVSKT